MSLIRKHVAVLQAWACLALVFLGVKSPDEINEQTNSLLTDARGTRPLGPPTGADNCIGHYLYDIALHNSRENRLLIFLNTIESNTIS